LSESEQGKFDDRVSPMMERGPNLGFPFSSLFEHHLSVIEKERSEHG
jgi:hypothetical protein